jgi:hypothetical protein
LFPQPRRRQIHISFRRLRRLLLERVKHVDHIGERGHIDHPKGAGSFANPDLANARANRRHGPPIIRVEPTLYTIQLVSCLPSGIRGETPKIVQRAAEERDRFHTPSYIGSDIMDPKLRFKLAILIAAATVGGGRTTDQ